MLGCLRARSVDHHQGTACFAGAVRIFPAQAILPGHSRPWRPAPLRSVRSGIILANWSVARTHTHERSQSGLAGVTFSPGQTVTMLDGYAGITPSRARDPRRQGGENV